MNYLFKLGQLFIITGLSLLIGCRFSFNETGGKPTDSTDSLVLVIAKKALRSIQENKPDSLEILIDSKVLRKTKPEQITWIMQEGQSIIDNYLFPNDTLILKSQSINYTTSGVLVINTLSLPFQHKIYKDSVRYFHFTLINNKIQKILINNYHPGINIIEPKRTEPHLQKIDMQTDNIRWFRIWYDGGSINKNKKYGSNRGYYAVSGNREKLEKIGMKDAFQDIFKLISSANFDSLDYKYRPEDEISNPEWLYLRFKFHNEEYKNLGEFQISYYINEDGGKKEEMSDYIVIKHTEKTRYLLLKDKNPELVQKLIEVAHHDYQKFYEIIP
ncbi:MAG: hypothetical protein MUO72_10135 [Bacteroidales bacterium]|nr:hypothetical protein [Bacteroidales bacterium]